MGRQAGRAHRPDLSEVYLDADQVEVEGRAFLWPSSPLVVMPEDLPERLASSVLDVCGAPAQTQRLVADAESVLMLGMGKSGMMCAAAARAQMGEDGHICAFDFNDDNMEALHLAGLGLDLVREDDVVRERIEALLA